MRVPIIIICLLYVLLMGGRKYSFTGYSNNTIACFTDKDIKKHHLVANVNAILNNTSYKTTSPENEDEYIVDDSIEDEDSNSLLLRKFRLLASNNLTVTRSFVRCDLHKCFKAPDHLGFHLNYKYITHRAIKV